MIIEKNIAVAEFLASVIDFLQENNTDEMEFSVTVDGKTLDFSLSLLDIKEEKQRA